MYEKNLLNISNILSTLKREKIFNIASNHLDLQAVYFLDLLNYYLNNIYNIKIEDSILFSLNINKWNN